MSVPDPDNKSERIKLLHERIFTLFWFAFRRLAQRLQKYGITHPQFITLISLVTHGQPATMRQLTQVTLQDPPTMTGIVNRLVKMGLLRRTRSEEDRRVVWVEATPKGIELINAVQQNLNREDPYGFHDVSDTELAKVEDFLDYILVRYMKEIHQQEIPDLATARKNLHAFAGDPLGFVKSSME